MLEPWYDVRTSLCKAYGETLIHWADNAVSYDPDMTYEEWTALLRKHGEALLAFVEGDDEDILTDDHQLTIAAREALHWTADNLLTLWD